MASRIGLPWGYFKLRSCCTVTRLRGWGLVHRERQDSGLRTHSGAEFW